MSWQVFVDGLLYGSRRLGAAALYETNVTYRYENRLHGRGGGGLFVDGVQESGGGGREK